MKRNDEMTIQPIRDGLLTLYNKTYLKGIKQLIQKITTYTEYTKKLRKRNAFFNSFMQSLKNTIKLDVFVLRIF